MLLKSLTIPSRGLKCHFSGNRGWFCQNLLKFFRLNFSLTYLGGHIWGKIPQNPCFIVRYHWIFLHRVWNSIFQEKGVGFVKIYSNSSDSNQFRGSNLRQNPTKSLFRDDFCIMTKTFRGTSTDIKGRSQNLHHLYSGMGSKWGASGFSCDQNNVVHQARMSPAFIVVWAWR